MSLTPSEIGARAEREVAMALVRSGKDVFLPLFAPHSRVDLVYADEAGLHRVQVKSGAVRGDRVGFRTCSNTKNIPKDYRGEIDVFGVYVADLDQVFLVPVGDVASRYCHLRLGPALNNQRQRVHWARDYLIGR